MHNTYTPTHTHTIYKTRLQEENIKTPYEQYLEDGYRMNWIQDESYIYITFVFSSLYICFIFSSTTIIECSALFIRMILFVMTNSE